MSSCVENSLNLSQFSQTDISFTDCTSKYLPLDKVYVHILDKVHEALFELKKWDCSFDRDVNKTTEPPRDTIIRRAGKRTLTEEDSHVTCPTKVTKQEPASVTALSTPASPFTASIRDDSPAKTVVSPFTLAPDLTISPFDSPKPDTVLVTPTKTHNTPPFISPRPGSSPFTSPRPEISPFEKAGDVSSPVTGGIVGVLYPTANAGASKKIDNTAFDGNQFNPFLDTPYSDNKKMAKHIDDIRTLRIALSNAIQNSEKTELSPIHKAFLSSPPSSINRLPTNLLKPELNLADLMLHNNLFRLPPLQSSKQLQIPSEYQLLDDTLLTTKTEVLSPGSDTTKEKLHQCPYCEAKFNQKSNLKTHVFGVHQFKLSTGRTCKIITSKDKLKEHMKTHPNRGFKCQQCDTSFDTHIRLLRHMKIHSSERPYKCTYCPKSFVYKWNLTEHVRIHTGEKPFVCRLCGKGFCQSSTLKRHSLAMHTTEKPYKCSQCEESFVRILLLKKHFVNQHMSGPVRNTCPPTASHPSQQLTPDALSMLHMFNNTGNQF